MVLVLAVHCADDTELPFSQKPQPVTVLITNWEGKYTRISKLLVNEVIALKLNMYNDDVDFAKLGLTENVVGVNDWLFVLYSSRIRNKKIERDVVNKGRYLICINYLN